MARMAVKEARWCAAAPGAPGIAEAVAAAAQLACVLEASAEKPGNITPTHDFADMSYEDMLRSAIALGPEMGRADERGVGTTVLAAVEATRRVASANTNLGIALLLAPLARATLLGGPLRERVEEVLAALTVDDARAAYAAIRAADAGGLDPDEPVEHDVRDEPAIGLREAMAAAAERDSVAGEYATGFAVTFDIGRPALRRALDDGLRLRADVVLHGLVQAAGAGRADRRVRGARVGDVERAQRRREPIAQRRTAERGRRERREQQRDPEVRVRRRRAPRRLHDREDRLAHPALPRPRQCGADRDGAAQHVLVGGVVEVVGRRDVARLLRADLEHARQLPGTGDAVGRTNGRRLRVSGRALTVSTRRS